ncbi:MAG TPA: hypothetical protein VFS04_08900 [Alphaproteobacteria bacterium]|nr:hypothetical protein [Alphaproteobacteria bacterium]
MRLIVSLALGLLLMGCASSDPNQIRPVSPSEMAGKGAQSVMVVGISVKNSALTMGTDRPVYGGWVSYNPATGQRVGKTMLRLEEGCGPFEFFTVACSSTQYRAFPVPPGDYALAWFFNGSRMTTLMEFASASVNADGLSSRMNSVSLSDQARLRPSTLRFNIKPNEILYVGTMVVDFKKGAGLAINLQNNMAEAKRYMAPSGLADRMIERRMAAQSTSGD